MLGFEEGEGLPAAVLGGDHCVTVTTRQGEREKIAEFR